MRRLAGIVVRWPAAVILVWVAMAVLLPQSFPSLNEMAQKNPLAMLPGNAPSSVAAREMTKGFSETGTDDLLLVVLSDERGVGGANEAGAGRDQEATYRKLVTALRDDPDVVMLQDFLETPALRTFLTSKDGKAWVVPVGLTGALGTPQAYAAFNRVSGIVAQNTAAGPVRCTCSGLPAVFCATMPDTRLKAA